MNPPPKKAFTIFSLSLVLVGLLVNPRSLGLLLTQDGSISELSDKVLIGLFDLFCVLFGITVFTQRKSLNRKHFFFTLLTIILMFGFLEGGFRIAYFFIRLGDNERRAAKQASLAPYKDKEWAKDLFREIDQIGDEKLKERFGWKDSEYHGKYVNLNPQGIRETWNPTQFNEKKPKILFVFGGSTVWGLGARDDHTIPSAISKQLYHKGYPFAVQNYGDSSLDFNSELDQLTRLLKEGHKPDYVIFYDGFNDVMDAYFSEGEEKTPLPLETKENFSGKAAHDLVNFRRFFRKHSLVFKVLLDFVDSFSPTAVVYSYRAERYTGKELQELAGQFVQNYPKLLKPLDPLSKTYGFKYLIFWQPTLFTEERLTKEEEEAKTAPRLNDRDIGKLYRLVYSKLPTNPSLSFFNISDALQNRTKPYYYDWCHLSEEGNEAVAARIVEIFEREF